MIRIVIEGDCLPAARPRFSGKRAYQPQGNRDYRQLCQWAAKMAMKGAEPLKCAVAATVKIYRRFQPTSRRFGDVDNFLKALFDALNQIVFDDDSQIVRCSVEKFTDKTAPRAEITIEPAESPKAATD